LLVNGSQDCFLAALSFSHCCSNHVFSTLIGSAIGWGYFSVKQSTEAGGFASSSSTSLIWTCLLVAGDGVGTSSLRVAPGETKPSAIAYIPSSVRLAGVSGDGEGNSWHHFFKVNVGNYMETVDWILLSRIHCMTKWWIHASGQHSESARLLDNKANEKQLWEAYWLYRPRLTLQGYRTFEANWIGVKSGAGT
jgi:hypothetical protein